MRLVALFLGIVAALLLPAMLLTWWVDPFGEFYDGDVLAAAVGGGEPCLISDDLVGSGSWLAFKEDVFEERGARTIVLGTSRVLKMASLPGERDFANVGIPGTGVETLEPVFRRLQERRPGPLTVYVGVELFWFNPSWNSSVDFLSSHLDRLRYLLARQNVRKSLSIALADPSLLLHRWTRERVGGRCALDRASRLAEGARDAWEPDGSFAYRQEVAGLPEPPPADYGGGIVVDFEGVYFGSWHSFARGRLQKLDQALQLARSYGWRVVGFAPPSTGRHAAQLLARPSTELRWRQFSALVPPVFERNGFVFVDTRRAGDVPCEESDFYGDYWHARAPCLSRVRELLDSAG